MESAHGGGLPENSSYLEDSFTVDEDLTRDANGEENS